MPPKNPNNIYQRILAVMAEVSYVKKEKPKAKPGAKELPYAVVNNDDVVIAIRPALIKHGIVVVPTVKECKQDGNRTQCKVQVDFVSADNPEDRVSVVNWGYGIDAQDKGPGKALTYAVKGAILKLFMFQSGDDPDLESVDHEPAPAPVTITNQSGEKLLKKSINTKRESLCPDLEVFYQVIKDKWGTEIGMMDIAELAEVDDWFSHQKDNPIEILRMVTKIKEEENG